MLTSREQRRRLYEYFGSYLSRDDYDVSIYKHLLDETKTDDWFMFCTWHTQNADKLDLTKLCSPHWKTLIKVWVIKNQELIPLFKTREDACEAYGQTYQSSIMSWKDLTVDDLPANIDSSKKYRPWKG